MSEVTIEQITARVFPPDGQLIPVELAGRWANIHTAIIQLVNAMNGAGVKAAGARTPEYFAARNARILKMIEENPDKTLKEIASLAGETFGVVRSISRERSRKALAAEAYVAMSGEDLPKSECGEQSPDATKLIPTVRDIQIVEKINEVPGQGDLQDAKPEQPETSTTRNLRTLEELTTVPAGEDDSVHEPVLIEIPSEQPKIAAPDKSPGLKIPHEEDEWLWKQIEAKTARRDILAELQKRRPKCSYADLNYRLQWLRDKREDKKRVTDKTAKEIGQEKWIESAEAKPPTNPEPKAIGRAELDAKIWGLWKAGKTPKAISDDLCSEGYYYGEQRVRRMLLQQGADL